MELHFVYNYIGAIIQKHKFVVGFGWTVKSDTIQIDDHRKCHTKKNVRNPKMQVLYKNYHNWC